MSKRPYKTTAQRKKEGWRSNSLPKNDNVIEPEFPSTHPPKPDYLDNEASIFWDFICPILVEHGVVKKTDGDILACVCQTRARLIAVYKFIQEENPSMVQEKIYRNNTSGEEHAELKESPYFKMEDTLQKRFRLELKELGLTPIGRIGIGLGEKKLTGDDL